LPIRKLQLDQSMHIIGQTLPTETHAAARRERTNPRDRQDTFFHLAHELVLLTNRKIAADSHNYGGKVRVDIREIFQPASKTYVERHRPDKCGDRSAEDF